MQFRVDAEIQALTRDLQALAMDHRIVVCTSNRPFAIAMATSFAWASAAIQANSLAFAPNRLRRWRCCRMVPSRCWRLSASISMTALVWSW